MAVTSIGQTSTRRAPAAQSIDVIYQTLNNTGFTGGVISGYALSGGSAHVGGFWPMQAGSYAGVTNSIGGLIISFPYAFQNVPASVVATVNGSDYVCRLAGKSTTDFTVKVLQVGVNWTSGNAVTSVNDSTVAHVPAAGGAVISQDGSLIVTDSTLYAASASGGTPGTSFIAPSVVAASTEVFPYVQFPNTWSDNTVVISVSGTTSPFVVSVSGFLTAAPNVSVTIDWIAAA